MEGDSAAARRVMVVADGSPRRPAKNAFGGLFKNPISPAASRLSGAASSGEGSVGRGGAGGGGGGGEVDFLDGMKRACAAAKPKLKVAVEKAEVAEGKDKAAVIVAHSAATNVELLIIGQKKNALSKSILGARRGLSFKGLADTAEYAIENSKCTCVAVQRKANGGYLLNSKTHKNF
uniref:Universal stress protein 29 n=1 Tax=Salvia miltiorrhiza TaxID=226208 RepID=A0A290YXT9_SALMI|nr:universal stress protein 29 [Salvia miltiorrhiza]